MKKSRFNLLIGLSSGIIIIAVIVLTNGLEDLIHQLTNLSIEWLWGAIICMFSYWVLEGTVLHIVTQFLYAKQRFIASFKITMIGQFFNAITPFSTGGQPAQLYVMIKDGMDAGSAGSILMIKFIVYQSVLTIYSFAVIVLKMGFFREKISHFIYFSVMGFMVNSAVIIFSILFSRSRNFTRKVLKIIFKGLRWIRIVKDHNKAEKHFEEELDNFHHNARLMRRNKKVLLQTAILTFLQLTAFFLIPYCIYRSFKMKGAAVIDMISAQAFVTMVSSFIPLPGAVGAAEGSFYLFFGLFFSATNIMSAILLWRVITFYSGIAVGGLVAAVAPEKPLQSDFT